MNQPSGAKRKSAVVAAPQALTAVQRKRLRERLVRLRADGEAITSFMLPELVKSLLNLNVSRGDTDALLTQLGYRKTGEQNPVVGSDATLDFTAIWAVSTPPRLMTEALKSQHLANRLSEMMAALVSEVMEDPQIADVPVGRRAEEATRVFAMKLGEAVLARSPHGGKATLASCADISSITFRSV